jgi:hypothetical protein
MITLQETNNGRALSTGHHQCVTKRKMLREPYFDYFGTETPKHVCVSGIATL